MLLYLVRIYKEKVGKEVPKLNSDFIQISPQSRANNSGQKNGAVKVREPRKSELQDCRKVFKVDFCYMAVVDRVRRAQKVIGVAIYSEKVQAFRV